MKAVFNNQTIAESNDTIVVEGNHYFPPDSINKEFFKHSDMHTNCPFKGEASYYMVEVDGEVDENAAWYYPTTNPGYENIAGYVAFWHGVEVVE